MIKTIKQPKGYWKAGKYHRFDKAKDLRIKAKLKVPHEYESWRGDYDPSKKY